MPEGLRYTPASMGVEERSIWLDGVLVPWSQACLHVLSQSAARGSLVFDVMPCYPGEDGTRILGLVEHTERFVNSAKLCGMDLQPNLEELLRGVAEVVHANPDAQIVKLSAYFPGVALDVLPADPHPSVALAAFALRDFLPERKHLGGLEPARLRLAQVRKMPSWVLSPQAKLAAGYLHTSIAKQQARKEGFNDVLLLDERDDIAESSTQIFFLVESGQLFTASVDTVLAGITRRIVLELAADEGVSAREGSVPVERLQTADEAFLTGTTSNIWPVAQVDEREFSAPHPGPMTARLMGLFHRMLQGDDPVFSPRWMQPV